MMPEEAGRGSQEWAHDTAVGHVEPGARCTKS
jgi:hypothetical protein